MLEQSLLEAIKKEESVLFNEDGSWKRLSKLQHSLRQTFGLEKQRRLSVAKFLNKALDNLESIPVNLFTNQQKSIYQSCLEAGEKVVTSLEKYQNDEITQIKSTLQRKLIALQYRIGSILGGVDPIPVHSTLSRNHNLEHLAVEWKKSLHIFQDKSLSKIASQNLLEATRYPLFIDLILVDSTVRNSFFEWAIRDHIAIQPFIEYPALQEKISSCGLNGRIGRLGGNLLKVQVVNNQKIVTLAFEGKDQNILDENSIITFRGNYSLKIAEIYKVFGNKVNEPGNLEAFLKLGITNWNVNELGYWDAEQKCFQSINLAQDNWWEQLPLVEVFTREEAQEKFGSEMDGKNWRVAAVATRLTPNLDLYNNHAFLEIIIPQENGCYAQYDFGKVATDFPLDPIQRVIRVCENVSAAICYPDDNFFYTQRQYASRPFIIIPEEGLKFMDSIRADIYKGRQGQFVYQIESENCAEWTQKTLEKLLGSERVPNLFLMPYLKTEPTGAMGAIFSFVRTFPRFVQDRLFMLLHIPLGAKRGRWIMEDGKRVWKSMATHQIWETVYVYLPAYLHHQLQGQPVPVAATKETLAEGYHTFYNNILSAVSHVGNVASAPVKRHVGTIFNFAQNRSVLPNTPLAARLPASSSAAR